MFFTSAKRLLKTKAYVALVENEYTELWKARISLWNAKYVYLDILGLILEQEFDE